MGNKCELCTLKYYDIEFMYKVGLDKKCVECKQKG